MTDAKVAPRFFLISPPIVDASSFASQIEPILASGDVACLLLEFDARRESDAKRIARDIAPVVQSRGVALLVRDPVFAVRCGLDGAHISPPSDAFETTLGDAIASLKPERIVGAGGVRTKHDAMVAAELEVDYLMFGEPSADDDAPPLDYILDRVEWWSEIFTVPCVAYAGRLSDVPALVSAGADFIGLGADLWSDARGPSRALAEAKHAFSPLGERAR